MAIAPFWFSTEHLWSAIAPFWLSADEMWNGIQYLKCNSSKNWSSSYMFENVCARSQGCIQDFVSPEKVTWGGGGGVLQDFSFLPQKTNFVNFPWTGYWYPRTWPTYLTNRWAKRMETNKNGGGGGGGRVFEPPSQPLRPHVRTCMEALQTLSFSGRQMFVCLTGSSWTLFWFHLEETESAVSYFLRKFSTSRVCVSNNRPSISSYSYLHFSGVHTHSCKL